MNDYHAFELFGIPAVLFGVYLMALLVAPLAIEDRSLGIEFGQWRFGYTRHGWAFQREWRRSEHYTISGLWPWYRPSSSGTFTINKSDKLPPPVMIIHCDGTKEYNI